MPFKFVGRFSLDAIIAFQSREIGLLEIHLLFQQCHLLFPGHGLFKHMNQKYQMARDSDINMQIKLNDLSQISFPTEDLVVLLSNLLDNAIEACQKVTGRKEILCDILCGDSLYISVRNTSLPVEITDGNIRSDKMSKLEHGYGIPAIKMILDQMQAEYTFACNDGWFQFVADIPIE